MREQLYATLRAAGVVGEPLGAIAKNGAIFAFTEKQLAYGNPGQATAVHLADITRIHSDDAGRLHIETGEHTPISAPLQGFKSDEVRRFFQDVRDATARAKQLPQPRPSGGSPWKGGWRSPGEAEAAGERQVVSPIPEAMAPAPVPMPRTPTPPPRVPTSAPTAASTAARPSGGTGPDSDPTGDPAPAPRDAAPAHAEPPTATEQHTAAPAARPQDPDGAEIPATSAGTALARLGLLGGRLRLLAGLLLLLALGLGWLQFSGGAELSAIWTVAVGGIGALALFALADLASVVAALGRGELPSSAPTPSPAQD